MVIPSVMQNHLHNNHLCVIVKPHASQTKILYWDEHKQGLRVAVAAVPDKNKANKELISFFSKLTKKRVTIVKGLKSREKLLRIE